MTGEITAAKTEAASGHGAQMPNAQLGAQPAANVEFDTATEKRLIRKLDQRLVLLAFLCCMCTQQRGTDDELG